MHRTLLALAAIAFALVLAPALADQSPAPTSLTVPIQAQNSSGQTGVAVLTPMTDNKTKVDVSVSGEPSGASEPAHVHLGTCNKLNVAPKYPLNPVVNGKSSTVLDLPISQLETTPMAINLHQSAANIGTYVACGNIVSVTAPTSPAPASPPGMAPSPG